MMNLVTGARGWAAAFFLGNLAFAQSSAPPPTRPPAVAAQSPDRTVKVVYAHGQIEIQADNSSLTQILHDIAAATGMKITGSVAEGRVFGKYGPAAPAEIIQRLLDGTGTNILLEESASGAPAVLILTPQNGPPTPPNPAAAQQEAVAVEAEPSLDKPLTVVGSTGEPTVVRDINGTPISEAAGAQISTAAAPPPPTPEQVQQHAAQMQQQQQQLMQQQASGH